MYVGKSVMVLASSVPLTATGTKSTKDADFYADRHFDDTSFFGKRRQGREKAGYLTFDHPADCIVEWKRRISGQDEYGSVPDAPV